MATILSIETATEICSVALSESNNLIAHRETNVPNSHAKLLAVYVEELFQEADLPISSLDAVAVSSGPGSYTGLRIGVSLAKGICFANNLPLIAIPTLESMAYGALLKTEATLLAPMIDARRMEVYTAIYNRDLEKISNEQAIIVDENAFSDLAKENTLAYFGNGAQKCKTIIESDTVQLLNDILPSALYMYPIASEYYQKKNFVDTAYFEPFYLKEFQAKISKVKGLD